MINLFLRIKNALKLFVWALRYPAVMEENNFKMLSCLLTNLMQVATEKKAVMFKIAHISMPDGDQHEMVTVWAGAGMTANPTERISQLWREKQELTAHISKLIEEQHANKSQLGNQKTTKEPER